MAFSDATKRAAWLRAGGRCECTRIMCGHVGYRCNAPLVAYGWHAHHKTAVASGGGDDLGNCEALCIACHKSTGTYGF